MTNHTVVGRRSLKRRGIYPDNHFVFPVSDLEELKFDDFEVIFEYPVADKLAGNQKGKGWWLKFPGGIDEPAGIFKPVVVIKLADLRFERIKKFRQQFFTPHPQV